MNVVAQPLDSMICMDVVLTMEPSYLLSYHQAGLFGDLHGTFLVKNSTEYTPGPLLEPLPRCKNGRFRLGIFHFRLSILHF